MKPITEAELNSLKATKNEREWNAACDAIKKARNGSYPDDWWPKVKLTGLMDAIFASWDKPGDPEIRVETISNDDLLNGKW